MPRRNPPDYAGAWWHITNRGIAKRTVFAAYGARVRQAKPGRGGWMI